MVATATPVVGQGEGSPEGPYVQLLRNLAPKSHTVEGTMGPNSLMVVYVDPLGSV